MKNGKKYLRFSKNLQDIKKRKTEETGNRYTQDYLADSINVSTATIGNWFNGRALPDNGDNFKKLLEALNLDSGNETDSNDMASLVECMKTSRQDKMDESFLSYGSTFPFVSGPLIKRSDVFDFLNERIINSSNKVVTLYACGGSGKSTSVLQWLTSQKEQIKDKYERVFLWTFYVQGQTPEFISIDLFFEALGNFLKLSCNSSDSTKAKAQACLTKLKTTNALLVIDGTEALQYPPGSSAQLEGRFKDIDAEYFFSKFPATINNSCILTTRIKTKFHEVEKDTDFPSLGMLPLSKAEVFEFLKAQGLQGNYGELIVYDTICNGHPLSLRLLARGSRQGL